MMVSAIDSKLKYIIMRLFILFPFIGIGVYEYKQAFITLLLNIYTNKLI